MRKMFDRSHAERGNGRTWISAIPLLCLLLLLAGPAFAATIKVTPDRDPVRMDETFNLVFSSGESVDDDPDFSPLAEDFNILSRNQSSQVSIVNGKMSKTQEWTLSLSPKRTGAIPIPPIAFGNDRSQPASVTVLESGAAKPSTGGGDDAELMLEMEATPKNPYVQAQVIVTVRVLLRVNLAGADLSEPTVTDALVERLGEDRRYSTLRNGREYAVIERKYALFPQKSGLLRIDPLQLTAQVEVGGRSFFSRSTRAMRVRSEAVDLKVRPQPPEFTGTHWLPAADLKLEESWPQNPPQAKADEPITRTLTLRAEGATVSLLPELGADLRLDPTIKQYPDQPALNEEKLPTTGISGTRQEKTALIPAKPGEYKLPAVEIPWWNTKTERMETTRIPERTLKVEASAEPAQQQATPPEPTAQTTLSMSTPQEPAKPPSPAAENPWFWLALLFGLGWLGTGLAWWHSRRQPPPAASVQPQAGQAPDRRLARKALREACAKHDPAAARLALLAWASTRWPDRQTGALAEIAGLAGGSLAEEIERINRKLYGNGQEEWNGNGLWMAVEAVDNGKHADPRKQPTLEPMYR